MLRTGMLYRCATIEWPSSWSSTLTKSMMAVTAAIDEGVPAHVLSSALYERFSSRGEADFANKLLSAMRYEFGGHIEKPGDHS